MNASRFHRTLSGQRFPGGTFFRRTLLGLSLGLTSVAVLAAPTVEMWKDPNCGCCDAWAEHMQDNGFEVVSHATPEMSAVKRENGVHPELASCHTAKVGEHVIEGHVPASDVKRLLESDAEPAILAVPGMPHGSPGMETGRVDEYAVYLWRDGEKPQVFSQYPNQ